MAIHYHHDLYSKWGRGGKELHYRKRTFLNIVDIVDIVFFPIISTRLDLVIMAAKECSRWIQGTYRQNWVINTSPQGQAPFYKATLVV